jgi:hypothetical protein
MNGIEMATTIRDICHVWQINHGHSKDTVTGAFVIYDFMKTRGEDVTLTPAVVIGFDCAMSVHTLLPNISVSVKSDIGKVDLVDACVYSSNLQNARYFTTMTDLKAWMNGADGSGVMEKEKQKETVEEYMAMMKISLRVRSKDRAIREFRSEKYKEMKAYVEDEYKKYIMGFIKIAITHSVSPLPFTDYIMGVPLVGILIPPQLDTVNVDDIAVYFSCPVLRGTGKDTTLFAIGASVVDGARQKRPLSMREAYVCVEKIMTIFRKITYDKLHGFMGWSDEMMNFRNENPIIIPNIDDVCCVCHDPCLVKTKCSHTLCLQCWGSIIRAKYPKDADYDTGHINCPMCRQAMMLSEDVPDADVDKLD